MSGPPVFSDLEAAILEGVTIPHVTVSGDYTADAEDDLIVGVDDTSSTRTVTLPSDVNEGRFFIIVDESNSASTNGIDLATEGSENIDGSSSVTGAISSDSGQVRVYYDGSNWFTW